MRFQTTFRKRQKTQKKMTTEKAKAVQKCGSTTRTDSSHSSFEESTVTRSASEISSGPTNTDSNFTLTPPPHSAGKTISFLEALIHFVKGNLGTGILAMPMAFHKAGLLVGAIALPLMAIICTHSMQMLVSDIQYTTITPSVYNMTPIRSMIGDD